MERPKSPRSTALTIMQVVSTLELLSLVAIVTNRVTIHSPAVTSAGGPVHGLLYVSTIVLALLLPFPRSAKWLAIIPGIGGLLAIWRARRAPLLPAQGVHSSRAVARVPIPPAERRAAAVLVDGAEAVLSPKVTIGPLDFAVPRGRITGLIGPNGAGKTTALRIICGLVTPSAGSVTLVAPDVGIPEDGMPKGPPVLGALIESPGFLPSMTARQNLQVLTRLAGWPSRMVDEAMVRVGLADAARQNVGSFSLGMKQRLGLAAALLGEPSVVILDEPTNGLDPRGAIELRSFLRELADEGITVLVSSHALTDLEELCDHLIAMDGGRVLFSGTQAQLLASLPGGVTCTVEDSAELDALTGAFARGGHPSEIIDEHTAHIAGDPAAGHRLNALAAEAGIVLAAIVPTRPTLEEAFLALTAPGPDSTGQASFADSATQELVR